LASWKVATGISVVLVLGIAGLYVAAQPRTSDADQIRDALSRAVEASRNGQPGGVMELLSDQLTVNGSSQTDLSEVADVIRKSHPDVKFASVDPIVSGDQAYVVTDATIAGDVPVVGQLSIPVRNVKLVFSKEEARKWVLIPVHQWRLTSVSLAPGTDVSGLTN